MTVVTGWFRLFPPAELMWNAGPCVRHRVWPKLVAGVEVCWACASPTGSGSRRGFGVVRLTWSLQRLPGSRVSRNGASGHGFTDAAATTCFDGGRSWARPRSSGQPRSRPCRTTEARGTTAGRFAAIPSSRSSRRPDEPGRRIRARPRLQLPRTHAASGPAGALLTARNVARNPDRSGAAELPVIGLERPSARDAACLRLPRGSARARGKIPLHRRP